MPVATPELIVEAFAINGDKNVIPVASQIGITNGAASYNDGFPPLTRTSPSSGGVPPAGKDMQGILNAVSSYCAYMQGGGQFHYDATFSSNNSGYAVGVILQSAVTPSTFFLNMVASNTNDPDVTITGWLEFSPVGGTIGLQAVTTASGTVSDFALNRGIGFLDLNPATGDTNLTGINPANATDGQFLVITNVNASHAVVIKALDSGSAANARFRSPADFTLLQYNSVTFRFSSAIGMWVLA